MASNPPYDDDWSGESRNLETGGVRFPMTTREQLGDERQIPLTRGMVAIVDAADFERLNQWKWFAAKNRDAFYAVRTVRRTVRIFMHREVMGISRGDSRLVDHINPKATLDNRRSNLRLATVPENGWNSGIRKSNTSGFKGVSFHRGLGKYTARIRANGKQINLGSADTAEQAAELYKKAAIELHGEFARY